jgi:signal recognition particle GTPase
LVIGHWSLVIGHWSLSSQLLANTTDDGQLTRNEVQMAESNPHVIVLAGPNGAGKSTAAPSLLQDLLDVGEFVNADVIAQGLAGFDPDSVAFEAGAIMHARLRRLAAARRDFIGDQETWKRLNEEYGHEH